MGIYADHIFPRLMDAGLRGDLHRKYRGRALARARGVVLEIGFGTGLNLECYPQTVDRLIGLDAARVLEKRVRARIDAAPFQVERVTMDAAARLPFEDHHFDTVTSTWTLCSIEYLGAALAELIRVLKPGGGFLFLEHGQAEARLVARIQHAINPIQNLIGCGCNLNREIDHEIERAGFDIAELERFTVPGVPRTMGSVYLGAAHPPRRHG